MKLKSITSILLTTVLLSHCIGCSSEEEGSTYVPPSVSKNPNLAGNTSGNVTEFTGAFDDIVSNSGAAVSQEAAKKVAIHQAGVAESSVKGYHCIEEVKNDLYTYYITFWVGKVEYSYTISGTDGTVIFFSTKFHETEYVEPEEEVIEEEPEPEEFETIAGHLSVQQAKDVVFLHAGVSEYVVTSFKIADRINGSINEYEITFSVGEVEYYYTIMAASGIVTLSKKIEPEIVEPEPPQVVVPDVVPVPTVPTVPTPAPVIPDPVIPDVTAPEVTTPETTTPETTTPVAPSTTLIGAVSAKNAALAYSGISEGDTSRLSVSETTDSSGVTDAYYVTFFHNMDYHTYKVDSVTGSVQNG